VTLNLIGGCYWQNKVRDCRMYNYIHTHIFCTQSFYALEIWKVSRKKDT